MPHRIALLQSMAVFGGVREDALGFLLGRASTVTVEPNDFFFREDDDAQCMYVLETGRAAVVKRWKGHQYLLSHMAAGDCFGEMSIMDLRHRSASVVAVERCRAIELSSASLYALYEHDLEQFTLIQMNLGREVSRRLREADERLFQ
ncbi:cyclic nucleotide-binding domain-containing protein [Ramlibacter terrae]|uniref:Cyclic nucleotide-binding domain-containing protein n=1 Tax=Ramlibacter terrae TaxID=2732511 RepID=A0ABX6P4R8_9BURK|nr:cyclic nucleotide-binding domain-containing protein [Ramlibacter terrae]